MKNQYNVIKEKLEQGFWPLIRTTSGFYFLFTEVRTDGCLVCSGAQSSPLEALRPCKINHDVFKAENLDPYDLEIVEYFRPNDLFPSKPFTGGTKVEVSIDDYKGMEFEVLESEETSDMGLFYRLWLAKTQQSFIFSASYVYPRIEKQEEVKKPQDIIGEASVKALEEQGYTITKIK